MIHFNVKGAERKPLVKAIEDATGLKAVYTKVPECAYRIGAFKVSRTGDLTWEDSTEGELVKKVKEAVAEAGYVAEESNLEEGNSLTIAIPKEGFTEEGIENLKKIIASKEALLKKSLGTDCLGIEVTEDGIQFPWFHPEEPDDVEAYTHLVTALCEKAKTAKRVTAKERPVESEKYAFRCFLLRLGFVGSQYKHERKALMRNLTGSSAFKQGAR